MRWFNNMRSITKFFDIFIDSFFSHSSLIAGTLHADMRTHANTCAHITACTLPDKAVKGNAFGLIDRSQACATMPFQACALYTVTSMVNNEHDSSLTMLDLNYVQLVGV